jgi:NAD(P)-dependent dehydrogenase (short-subunit alcohol dehydrogenase family)
VLFIVGGAEVARPGVPAATEVNLLGAITATEVFLEQLKDGGGDVVNISSVAGGAPRGPETASTQPPRGG